MRLGFLEIGIIVVLVLLIFGITRMMRPGQNVPKREKQEGEKTGEVRHPRLRLSGIILIIVGIIILLVSVSLVKWIFWGGLWALIIVAIGLLVIIIARHR